MQRAGKNENKCFICRKKSTKVLKFKVIEKNRVPSSRKPLKDVILHVARLMKLDLKVPPKAELCQKCLQDLIDYDECVLRLLAVQKRLMHMIEKWASSNECDGYRLDDVSVRTGSNAETFQAKDEPEEQNDDEQMCTIEVERLENVETFSDPFIDDEDETQTDSLSDVDIKIEEPEYVEQEQISSNALLKEPATCALCSKVFKNKTRLKYHMNQEHKSKNNRTCSVCGITARDEEYLELHMNLHEGKTEHECRYCSKTYARKKNVIRHMQKHWDKKKFQCEKCGIRFSETTVLYNHKLQHEAEEQPLICSVCKQSFKTKRTYKGHMMTHREDRPRYSCQYCGKTFVEKYTLKVHLRVHGDFPTETEKRSPPIAASDDGSRAQLTCIICNCKFTNKDQYNQHMEGLHDVILETNTKFSMCLN